MNDEEYAKRYPEHWKTKAHKEKLEHAREFLSMLVKQGLTVAREQRTEVPYPGGTCTASELVPADTRELPFRFIGVDPHKYSAEKDKLLEDYQRENGR